MRRFLGILILLVIAVIGLLLVAPNFIPMDVYKSQVAQAAERATGRALTIDGDLKLAFFPRLQIELNDVTFANAEGREPEHMATMDRLTIRLEVMPLLRREVVVESFVLERPVIVLDVDRNGRANWEFDMETNPAPEADTIRDDEDSGGFALNEISLGDVRLVDGDVRYRDRRAGTDYHLQDIDLTVSLPTLQGPLGLDGALTYNDERLNLDTSIESPRGFFDGEQTPVDVALRSDVMRLTFGGSAAMATSGGAIPVTAGGDLDLDVPSVRDLARWTGSPIETPGGFGILEISGRAEAAGDAINFANANVHFDEMTGSGALAVNLGGSRPRVTGTLDLDKVDIRPYMGAPTNNNNRRRGNASSEWSTDPIDLSALRNFDADLDLTADEVLTPSVEMGRSVLDVTLRNGVLTANLQEMALYEGSGTAYLEVDARNDVAVIRQRANFSLVQALPLLRDLANFSSLEGIGNVSVDLTTRGRSQRDLVSALNGSGEIMFNNGTLKGINLAQLVRSVGSAAFDIETITGPQETDFAELGGTFDIENGVLTNLDMRLLNPLLRVTGRGTTNLVQRTVNYRVTPQGVWTLEGQGGRQDVTGLAVPVLITGTWDNLSFGPDVASIGEQLLRDQLGGRRGSGTDAEGESEAPANPAEALLRGLVGGGGSPVGSSSDSGAASDDTGTPDEEEPAEDEAEEEDEPPTAEDLFRQLLGD